MGYGKTIRFGLGFPPPPRPADEQIEESDRTAQANDQPQVSGQSGLVKDFGG